MAFFKRKDIGRIYVFKMVLPDKTIVHKIGIVNSDRSVDRMLEVLRSWFTKYRFVPYTELRLDQECQDPQKLEKHMHKILEPNRFLPNHKIDGGTELFVDLNELRVLHYIRAYTNSMYVDPPAMDRKGRETICQLLTH
jgi:hypothetical protein